MSKYISSDEQKELLKRWRSGDESAFRPLYESLVDVLKGVAHKYSFGDPQRYEEAFAAANEGLLYSLNAFDFDKGTDNYLAAWVQRGIVYHVRREAINSESIVKVPYNVVQKVYSKEAKRARREGKSYEEVAEIIGLDPVLVGVVMRREQGADYVKAEYLCPTQASHSADHHYLKKILRRFSDRLDPVDRLVFRVHIYPAEEDVGYGSTADELGVTRQAIYLRKQQIMEELEAYLEAHGLKPET